RERPRLVGPQLLLAPSERGGEIGQQPQRLQFALREGQEHLAGRRLREARREQREAALVAADDAELLTREPGQPVPRDTASLQQVSKAIPARVRGDLLANTTNEIVTELGGAASHGSSLLLGQPGIDLATSQRGPPATVRPAAGTDATDDACLAVVG